MKHTNEHHNCLRAAYDAVRPEFEKVSSEAVAFVQKVVSEFIGNIGMTGKVNFSINERCPYYVNFHVNGQTSPIKFYAYTRRSSNNHVLKAAEITGFRISSLNTATAGCSGFETAQFATAIFVGKLAENIERLIRTLNIFDWKKFNELADRFFHAESELNSFEYEARELKQKKVRSEIYKKLVIGARIDIGYRGTTHVIKSVKGAFLKMENCSGNYKKNEVADLIIAGKWKFV